MDIARLKYGQIQILQACEQMLGRCLLPVEIRHKFNLLTLKTIWGFNGVNPKSLDSSLESYVRRLAREIEVAGCLQDNGGPVESTGPIGEEWPVHVFDFKIFHAAENHKIDFMFKKAVKKSRLLDEVNSDEGDLSGKLAVI